MCKGYSLQDAGAFERRAQPADSDLSGRHVHQQHIGDAVQEGRLRARQRHRLPGRDSRKSSSEL